MEVKPPALVGNNDRPTDNPGYRGGSLPLKVYTSVWQVISWMAYRNKEKLNFLCLAFLEDVA